MKYALLTAGTRGDVQPFIALGIELTRRGHDVLLVAPDKFKEYAVDAINMPDQFKYASCGMYAVAQPSTWFQNNSFVEVLRATRTEMRRSFVVLASAFWSACESYQPDCIVVMSMSLQIGILIAERLDAACWSVHFAPTVPSRHTLPSSASSMTAYSSDSWFGIGGIYNYAMHLYEFARLALVAKGIYGDLLTSFKVKTLGLDANEGLRVALARFRVPILCAFSSVISPRPPDWPAEVMSTGPWVINDSSRKKSVIPSGCEELAAFLAANRTKKQPICIGFGSLSKAGASSLVHQIGERVLRLGRRCIIIGDLPRTLSTDERKLCVNRAPYSWLLPQCALLIHHGGAGTTVSALVAGIPSVVSPLLQWSDQPRWGALVEDRGVGVYIQQANPTDALIDKAILKALACADKAKTVGSRVRQEAMHGAEYAASLLSCELREIVHPRTSADEAFCYQHCVVGRSKQGKENLVQKMMRRKAAAAAREAKRRELIVLCQTIVMIIGVFVIAVFFKSLVQSTGYLNS